MGKLEKRKMVSIHFSQDLIDKAKEISKLGNMSFSKFVREAVKDEIKLARQRIQEDWEKDPLLAKKKVIKTKKPIEFIYDKYLSKP